MIGGSAMTIVFFNNEMGPPQWWPLFCQTVCHVTEVVTELSLC